MGYGHARHVGRTGDGDIDGIIDQDTLGLKRLYVQAKRWTNQVGEPEIRNFSGSLDAHGATRGILITTSDFTDTARKTAKTISIGTKHIRLVNGHELAHLILKHSIRVTPDTPQRFPKAGQKPPHPPHLRLRHTGEGRYPERRGGSLSSLLSTHSSTGSSPLTPKPTIAHIENSVECPPTARTIAVRRGLIARF